MPELPDLTVVTEAFHAALAGRPVIRAAAPGPLVVRGTPAELEALVGQELQSVSHRGKFVRFQLARDAVVVNAMLTGRFQLIDPTLKAAASTAVVLALGPRRGPPRAGPAWTRNAAWMPADDTAIEVRYRDPTQMGKVYLLPAGQARAVPGYEGGGGSAEVQGPDADDPALTIEIWRDRIRRHPGELKPLLRNQAFIAGIGNAYSDEILHAARLNPFRRRSSLASEEVDALYAATREALASATAILRKRVPPTFEKEVRDFLAVHLKGGQPCPRCGARISEVSSRSEATSWCRGCQR